MNTMIITLLPLFLAAKFDVKNETDWKQGIEVTYLIQSNAAIIHRPPSNRSDMDYDLETKISCQINDINSLTCSFHGTTVHSSLTDAKTSKSLTNYILDDIWTKKILEKDTFKIEFGNDGINEISINPDIEMAGQRMIAAFANHLDPKIRLSDKLKNDFEIISNTSIGRCKTRFLVTRTTATTESSNIIPKMSLFLISWPNESLIKPIEISAKIYDDNCHYQWYSAFTHREIRKLLPQQYHAKLDSAETFTVLSNSNFTSFSKTKMSIIKYEENINYILEESTTLSLLNINPAQDVDHNNKK